MAVNQLDIDVGKRINQVIESQENVSSRQFAISIGMDPSQFAKIVKGYAAISLEKLVEISSKYDVSIEWLITGKMKEEQFEMAEGDPGYKTKPAPGEMPEDLLSLLKTEVFVIQSSLDKLAKAAGVQLLVSSTTDHPVKEDLSLDRKKRSVKDNKSNVRKKGT